MTLIGKLFGWALSLLGPSAVDGFFGYLKHRSDNETERQRIDAAREQHAQTMQARVITAGMAHKAFWIPWLIATVPLACWFGWGMADTTLNGALPDVAVIPDGLLPWAQIAWGNLFYSGGGVAAASIISQAIARR